MLSENSNHVGKRKSKREEEASGSRGCSLLYFVISGGSEEDDELSMNKENRTNLRDEREGEREYEMRPENNIVSPFLAKWTQVQTRKHRINRETKFNIEHTKSSTALKKPELKVKINVTNQTNKEK